MSPPTSQTVLAGAPDGELARLAAEGDRSALEVLLRRHQPLVHRICRRLCANDTDALDATQEALIKVALGIGRFDGRSAFTTWLYRVTTNACLDELRRRRRRPQPLGSELSSTPASGQADQRSSEIGPPDAGQVGSDPADVAAGRIDVDRALASLPLDFRAAVVLRDLLGLDYAEIADVLGIPSGTVRSRIARGRAHLARLLEPETAGNPVPADERRTGLRGSGSVAPSPSPLSSPSSLQFPAPEPAPEASP